MRKSKQSSKNENIYVHGLTETKTAAAGTTLPLKHVFPLHSSQCQASDKWQQKMKRGKEK
jgi:hypothetical protein